MRQHDNRPMASQVPSHSVSQRACSGGKSGSVVSHGVGFFLSGQRVPASGIYEVHHKEHRLPHEVTLLRDQQFPPCEKCGTLARFKIVRVVAALDERREKIILNALAVMDDDDEEAVYRCGVGTLVDQEPEAIGPDR